MLRPCLDCGRLCKRTRCPEHERAHNRIHNTNRPLQMRVYGSAAWKRLARAVVDEAMGCHWCGATGERLTADHVIPIVDRPDLATVPENVVAACGRCQNLRRHAWLRGDRR